MDYLIIPVVLSTITGLVIIVLIMVIGQIIKARMSAISKRYLEKLVTELKQENAIILTELSTMKENLSSINNMMKEI